VIVLKYRRTSSGFIIFHFFVKIIFTLYNILGKIARQKTRGVIMTDKDNPIIADDSIQYLIDAFARNRAEIDKLKILENELRERICDYMGKHDSLISKNGEKLVNWPYKKGAERFDRDAFKKLYPSLDKQFTKFGEPSRAFSVLVKVV
jgi:hypothetical protein